MKKSKKQMDDYIRKVIRRALDNGMTLDQVRQADPEKLVKAYHESEMRMLDDLARRIKDNPDLADSLLGRVEDTQAFAL